MSRRAGVTSIWSVLAAIVVLGAMLLGTGTEAYAAGTSPAPGLTPIKGGPNGYYEFTAAPGQTVSAKIAIHNLQATPAAYDIYPVNATTSPQTGVSYGEQTTPAQGTAAWIHLASSNINMTPKQVIPVTFTVTIPAGTGPGDWVGGIAAQAPTPTTQQVPSANKTNTGVSLRLTTRDIIAVVVHVPGPAAVGMKLGPTSLIVQNDARQVVQIPMDNTGQLLFKPYLNTSISTCAGVSKLALKRQLDTFVPRTSIVFPWYLNNQVLPTGCYRSTVTVSNGQNGSVVAHRVTTFTIHSAQTHITRHPAGAVVVVKHGSGIAGWMYGVGAALIVVLILLVLLFMRQRRRNEAEKARLRQELAQLQDKTPLP